MDNLINELSLLQETYADTWGKMLKPIVIKKYSGNGDIFYTMHPDLPIS